MKNRRVIDTSDLPGIFYLVVLDKVLSDVRDVTDMYRESDTVSNKHFKKKNLCLQYYEI